MNWSQQPSSNNKRDDSTQGHHQMVNIEIRLIILTEYTDYILCTQRWRSATQSAKQDWELTVAQIMSSLLQNSNLKLKKVGKTTRPFRHDLNQIPYDYTEEMKNRFKGLGLRKRVPEELWSEVRNTVEEAMTKTIHKKKKCKKTKCLSEDGLQIVKKRESKG